MRGAILNTLATIGEPPQHNFVAACLDDLQPIIAQGAATGLLRSGDLEAMMLGVEKLQEWLAASDPQARIQAAAVLEAAGLQTVYRPLLKLLADPNPAVRRAGLEAAKKLNNPKLWPVLLGQLLQLRGRATLIRTLAAGGNGLLPLLDSAWHQGEQTANEQISFVKIAAGIKTPEAVEFLEARLQEQDFAVNTAVLQALRQQPYHAPEKEPIHQAIQAEIAQATCFLAVTQDIGSHPLLVEALNKQVKKHKIRLYCWLSFLYEPLLLTQIEQRLARPEVAEDHAFALDLLDETLPIALSQILVPLLDNLSPTEQLQQLHSYFPQESASYDVRIGQLVQDAPTWLRACAIHTAGKLGLSNLADDIAKQEAAADRLISETAVSAYTKLTQGTSHMASTLIEKIICLKGVPFFADVPEETLAEVAAALETIFVAANDPILVGDAVESSLYIIISGEAKMDNGDLFQANDTFGELMLLDPVAQPMSITAVSDVSLLKLDRDLFQEITQTHPEVAWKVMELLAKQLRWTQTNATATTKPKKREAVLDRLVGI